MKNAPGLEHFFFLIIIYDLWKARNSANYLKKLKYDTVILTIFSQNFYAYFTINAQKDTINSPFTNSVLKKTQSKECEYFHIPCSNFVKVLLFIQQFVARKQRDVYFWGVFTAQA